METVVCIDWFPGTCHLNNLAFSGVELHIQQLPPHRQFVKVMWQSCASVVRYRAVSSAVRRTLEVIVSGRSFPLWNSLPSPVVSSKTIEECKAQIKIIGTE